MLAANVNRWQGCSAICGLDPPPVHRPGSVGSTAVSVQFDGIRVGGDYTRQELAERWRYSGYQALARGVVTPANDTKIILFVTEQKQASAAPYVDKLGKGRLEWEGPHDHFAEARIAGSALSGDQIHLFHRPRHHAPFTYVGRLRLVSAQLLTQQPSRFVFEVV